MAEIRMPESGVKDNSNKAKREMVNVNDRKPAPIVKGEMRKRNLADRFAEVFFEGTLNDAVDYMVNELAIPTIKNGLISAIEVIFYGGSSRGATPSARRGDNVPYYTFSVGRNQSQSSTSGRNSRSSQRQADTREVETAKKKYDPRRIKVEDRGMAERVLEDLKHELKIYGQVSVERLFDLVGIDSDWTSTSYGWISGELDNARVRPCPGGWCFELPDPGPID